MNTIQKFLIPLKPGNWTQFALGVLGLLLNIMNLNGTWYNLIVAVLAIFTAGFTVAGSILSPIIERLTDSLTKVDYDNMGKNAAESFKKHIREMRARGEFPPDVQIIVGDEPGTKPPIHLRPERL